MLVFTIHGGESKVVIGSPVAILARHSRSHVGTLGVRRFYVMQLLQQVNHVAEESACGSRLIVERPKRKRSKNGLEPRRKNIILDGDRAADYSSSCFSQ